MIYFPEGALATQTAITIVSKESPWISYDMLPHGLVFAKPVYVMQGLGNTAVYGTPAMCSVYGVYLASGNDTINTDDTATAAEKLLSFTYSKFFSWDGFSSTTTSIWLINHFSRYILASG
jgi:hypothetical protein